MSNSAGRVVESVIRTSALIQIYISRTNSETCSRKIGSLCNFQKVAISEVNRRFGVKFLELSRR